MMKPIPKEIDTIENSGVLKMLHGQSCHSDIVLPISRYLDELDDVKSYCQDGQNFSYICWYVNGIIFAYATGMQEVTVKLSQTGQIDLSKLEEADSVAKANSWFSIPYNSGDLKKLVFNAYTSAKRL